MTIDEGYDSRLFAGTMLWPGTAPEQRRTRLGRELKIRLCARPGCTLRGDTIVGGEVVCINHA